MENKMYRTLTYDTRDAGKKKLKQRVPRDKAWHIKRAILRKVSEMEYNEIYIFAAIEKTKTS